MLAAVATHVNNKSQSDPQFTTNRLLSEKIDEGTKSDGMLLATRG